MKQFQFQADIFQQAYPIEYRNFLTLYYGRRY